MIRRLHVPLLKPEDVIPHLAKQDLHWRAGYSAQELALAWSNPGNDFPPAVRRVLQTSPEYSSAEFIDGFFEREVNLGSPGRNSQTDLMVIVGLGETLGVIAVEGKVDESFADLVVNWNTSASKQCRLDGLCTTLGVESGDVGHVRYQLLHRTASAVYESKRYRSRNALVLVHSFSASNRWFEDLAPFRSQWVCLSRIPAYVPLRSCARV
jgi:hypothetical protein